MSKLFQHYCDCYGFQTYLFIGSQEEMLQELHKAPIHFNKESLNNFVSSIKSSDAGLTVDLIPEEGAKKYLICLPGFERSVDCITTLSHEVAHVAQLALLERTITDLQNDSCFHCFIYLHDSLFRVFLDKLNKWIDAEKKKDEAKKKEEDKENMNDNIESVVSNEEESTADVELKKEIENKEKAKKNKKK